MVKQFIIPAIIGIGLGMFCIEIHNDYLICFIYTFSDILLNILLLIGPILVFSSLTLGIYGIKNDFKFYLKFLLLIISSLFIGGIVFYLLLKFLYPLLLSNNMGDLGNQTALLQLPYPFNNLYQGVLSIKKHLNNALPLLTFSSILLGIILMFFKNNKPIINVFNQIEHYFFLFIKKVMLPLMPIWTISMFSSITYQYGLSGLILNDLIMSIIIFIFQLCFLFVMYQLASKYRHLAFKKIVKSAQTLFVNTLQMMGLGGNLILPYGVKAQERLGVNSAYAKTITASAFNLPGSFFANIGFSYGLIVIFQLNISDTTFINYIFLLIIATIIAPTVPLGVFSITQQLLPPLLGFNNNLCKIMSSLYFNQGTTNACINNCGDIYLGLLLEPQKRKKEHFS